MSAYFSKRQAPLRMPRSTPGVPDANGFVFHGPVGTGQIDVATALLRDSKSACAATHSPAAGGPLAGDPVLDPLRHRIAAAPPPRQVAPALDGVTPSNQARLLATGPAANPVLCVPGPPANAEAERVLSSFRGESRSLPSSPRMNAGAAAVRPVL
jgi:hypothetical protein